MKITHLKIFKSQQPKIRKNSYFDMEGSQTFKDMISIDKSKKLNLTNHKNKTYLISPLNRL